MKPRLLRKSDLLLIIIILAVAAACWVSYSLLGSGTGDIVVVSVDNKEYARLPLDKDTSLLITSANGGTNLLVIENKTAYMAESDCKNQVCVHAGRISKSGEIIVCLPHKVVVTIESSKNN
jgi:hypothetical protein